MTPTERIFKLEFILHNMLYHLEGMKPSPRMIAGWIDKAYALVQDDYHENDTIGTDAKHAIEILERANVFAGGTRMGSQEAIDVLKQLTGDTDV